MSNSEERLIVEPIKDHDLLVRLDEKMDSLSNTLTALVTSIDQRGADIEKLKVAQLLHEQETKQQEINFHKLENRVVKVETEQSNAKENIDLLKTTSIWLWSQRHPKISVTILTIFLIMLNFHDIIVPWVFGLFGYKTPP